MNLILFMDSGKWDSPYGRGMIAKFRKVSKSNLAGIPVHITSSMSQTGCFGETPPAPPTEGNYSAVYPTSSPGGWVPNLAGDFTFRRKPCAYCTRHGGSLGKNRLNSPNNSC